METYSALRVFGICGLASVLCDLDHPYSMVLAATIYPSIDEARLLHPLIFFVVCCVLLYIGTHVGRLYIGLVLRKKK